MHLDRICDWTHLHLKLKVLVLPLPAENVTRNAKFNRLLEAATARPKRTRHQVLDRKSLKKRRKKEAEGKRLTRKITIRKLFIYKPVIAKNLQTNQKSNQNFITRSASQHQVSAKKLHMK